MVDIEPKLIAPNALNVKVRVSSPSMAYVPLRVLLFTVHENELSELKVNENVPALIPNVENVEPSLLSIVDVAKVPAASVIELSLCRITAGLSYVHVPVIDDVVIAASPKRADATVDTTSDTVDDEIALVTVETADDAAEEDMSESENAPALPHIISAADRVVIVFLIVIIFLVNYIYTAKIVLLFCFSTVFSISFFTPTTMWGR